VIDEDLGVSGDGFAPRSGFARLTAEAWTSKLVADNPLDWIVAAVELGIDVFDANPPVRPLQRMMADRALHRRTTSAQHPNSERLDREPGPDDPAVAG
jgi:hypothetical protein